MSRENQKNRAEAVRESILDAALAIAVSEGFEALSVRKLAQSMKYSTGVIYYHFKDKGEIIAAIQQRQSDYLRDKISQAVSPEKSFAENLRDAFYEAFLLAVNEPKKYNLVALSLQSAHLGNLPPPKSGLHGMLASMMQAAVNRGEITVSDVESTAFAVWSSFLGFHIKISQMGLSADEAEKLFDAQVTMILYGLAKEVSK